MESITLTFILKFNEYYFRFLLDLIILCQSCDFKNFQILVDFLYFIQKFDIQMQVLGKTRSKLEELERKVTELETRVLK